MNRLFAITIANETTRLDNEGKGEASYTVTNSSTRPIRGQLKVKALGSTKAEWLSIGGETERNFAPNATQQVAVKIYVPPGTPAGKYSFRLDVVSVANPDDDFSEGPEALFEVKATDIPPTKFPWLIIVIAIAVVVVGGVVAWVLLKPKMVNVPNVVSKKAAEAERVITERNLKFIRDNKEDRNATEEEVIDQDPREGVIKEGSELKLTIKVPVPPMTLDNYIGRNVDEVRKFLEEKYRAVNLKPNETDREPPGKILAQQPAPGTQVKVGETVTLTIAAAFTPFPLPPVVGKPVGTAKRELEARGLKVSVDDQVNPSVPHEQVVEQTPAANTMVKSGESVSLKYAITLVTVPQLPLPKPPGFPGWPQWNHGKAIIEGSGLTLKEVRGDCSFVVEINPRPGLLAPKGTPVTIYTPGDRNKVCYQPVLLYYQAIQVAPSIQKYQLR
ncbi:MAG TPA: PASTA domain-containing protein [Blastocatellia bacterium]|nr:PASTA domain-containing protein [Blastocatellia bacterium]